MTPPNPDLLEQPPSPPETPTMPRPPNRILYIAALGNPGARYASTRHNAGALLLEAVLPRLRARWDPTHGANLLPFVETKRPTHYMNESGKGVVPGMMGFFAKSDKLVSREVVGSRAGEGIPATLVLLHDELEIAPGKLKIRYGGPESFSLRGHRGLVDVFAKLDKKKMWNLGGKGANNAASNPQDVKTAFVGAKDSLPREFSVLRIGYGIGRPETRGRDDVADYVLARMDQRELKGVEAAVDTVVLALEKELFRDRVYPQDGEKGRT